MRQAKVYSHGVLAGILTQTDDKKYSFIYEDSFLQNRAYTGISISLPKSQKEYYSDTLFHFFRNLLSEGALRKFQCTMLKIDEQDDFSLLLATAHTDTVGAVTVKEI